MKAWVTVLALTKGVIVEVEGYTGASTPEFFHPDVMLGDFFWVGPGEWYKTREEAEQRVLQMRRNAIAKLKRQIEHVRGMKIECVKKPLRPSTLSRY